VPESVGRDLQRLLKFAFSLPHTPFVLPPKHTSMSAFTRTPNGNNAGNSGSNGHSSYSDLFEDFFRSDALEVASDVDPTANLPFYQSDVFFNLATDQQHSFMNQTQVQASSSVPVYQTPFMQTPVHLVHAAAVCKPGFVRTKAHQRRNQHTTKKNTAATASATTLHNSGKPTVALVSPNTLYQASAQFPAFYQQQQSQAAAQLYAQLPQQDFYGYPIEASQHNQSLTGHSQQGPFSQQHSLYPLYASAMLPGFAMAPMPQAANDQSLQQQQQQQQHLQHQQQQQGQQSMLLPNSSRLVSIPASPLHEPSIPRASSSSSTSPTGLRGSPNTSDFVKQKLQAKIRARMIQKGQIPPNATAEEIRYYTSQEMAHGTTANASVHSKPQSALPTPKSSPKHTLARYPLSEKLTVGMPDAFTASVDPKDPMVQFSMGSQKQQLAGAAEIFCFDQLAQTPTASSSLAAAQTNDHSNLTAASYDQFFSDFILF
jgi:hypothetical protein